ncbi:DUF1616 domain-containing protein [Patescibacteria group bacterium]|nr:DUF1616 domain-containing protein [Patescibacteria group bacterium]MBU0963458.1 DUF1616 domain-containing protein [Patescibacteria group bacterium]
MKKNWMTYILAFVLVLVVVSLILGISLPLNESFRLVFGAVFVIFIPGFIWTWVIWSKDKIDNLERTTLSIVFSIAIVPLLVFILNKIGLLINTLDVIIEIFVICLIGIILLIFKNKKGISKKTIYEE